LILFASDRLNPTNEHFDFDLFGNLFKIARHFACNGERSTERKTQFDGIYV